MKNVTVVISGMLLLAMAGCTPQSDVAAVMNTESKRLEVYNMIMDSAEMRQEMRAVMHDHPQGGMMGMSHDQMGMGKMRPENMQGNMVQMMQQMHQKGMMDDACYYKVMQNLNKMPKSE